MVHRGDDAGIPVAGMVESIRGDKPPLDVEYSLTMFGRRFVRILDEVGR